MARYKVILAYDGSAFRGSQRQAGLRTVQGEFERSLQKLGWSGRSIVLAGRTDTGVHASGQVAAFDLDWSHTDEELLRALNSGLPADLSVRGVKGAAEKFHPRFDADSRCYRYEIYCDDIRNPLRERYAWRVWPEVGGSLLLQTAAVFTGRHDFAAFGSPTSPRGTTVRTVMKSEWKETPGGGWQFEIRADAFLFRMVRRIVFVQVCAAQGRCDLAEVREAVSSNKAVLPPGLAPANGLTLVEVRYGSDRFKLETER